MARGFLTPIALPADPASALHAAPKQYVDNNINDVALIGGTKTVYQTADVTKNASTALGDLTGLTVTLTTGRTYAFEMWLLWYSLPTADVKIGWTLPASTTGWWCTMGPPAAQVPVVGSERINYVDAGAVVVTSTLTMAGDDEFTNAQVRTTASPRGFLTTTNSGAIQVQGAQNTSDVSNTVFYTGSWLKVTRVA